jgi:hypothetical protein
MFLMKTIAASAVLVTLATVAAAQQPPARAIVNITGQLYRAQNNNHLFDYNRDDLVSGAEQKTLTLDAYRGFERWDTVRTDHIASVYAALRGAAR